MSTILQMVAFDEFQDMLKEKFNKSANDIIKQLAEQDEQTMKKQKEWQQFTTKAKQQLCRDAYMTPIQLIDKMQNLCEMDKLLDENSRSLCQNLEKWRTDKQSLANVISTLEIVKEIPESGLDNKQIENILDVFQQGFKGVKCYKALTSDFPYCDVQRRFIDSSYPSREQMQQIESNLHLIDSQGSFKSVQNGILRGSEFGRLDRCSLDDLYQRGFNKLAVILNTEKCNSSGKHWISFYVDFYGHSVEVFNSTDDYLQEITPIKKFAEFLAKELEIVMDHPFKVITHDRAVQISSSNCAVFSLFYIFARILQIPPQQVAEQLKNDKSENIMSLFKETLFG